MPQRDRERYLAYQRAYRLRHGMTPRVARPRGTTCFGCGGALGPRSLKYCSQRCLLDTQYRAYIAQWFVGQASGGSVALVSKYVRRFLIEQGGEQCSVCGWHQRHPRTGRVPLDVDHINGNYLDNSPVNLRLLCPNCHALTPTYKGMNRGRGRPYAIVRRQS
jgi:hypothetical protein